MGCTASTSVPSPPSTPLPNNLVFSNTWTAPPGSFCIDSISNNNAGDEDDISDLPPNSHRRTRSGYSTQLAFDPVHQRKLATLKELRDVSPKGDGSNTPPAIIRSPNTAPSSLRLKRTRPIKLKGERRMTAGQELLAPKPSKLKSSLFPKAPPPKLEMAFESPPSAALSSTEEDITPIVSNVKKQKPLAPSGRPPTHALSVEVNKKRPLNPSQWSPRVLSPKGIAKSPNNTRAFDFSDDAKAFEPPRSPMRSPKGRHKSPKSSSRTFNFSGANENSPPAQQEASPKFGFDKSPPRLVVTPSAKEFHNLFSPNKGEVRRSKNREKKEAARASGSETRQSGSSTETEVWHSVPKKTVNRMTKGLTEGGMGHCHPNAKKVA
ncbi:hypothetical protein TrVE_jg2011 [Triparma verrucosa]|uniref:Uncharacterized protein n=1 Tax=Triparma verrucosa TaxID=1606542 RepID=A0A9W7C7F2_9STRA|nr:hypothetical protein TrVE_jg2011 [Triparma verrucosa]